MTVIAFLAPSSFKPSSSSRQFHLLSPLTLKKGLTPARHLSTPTRLCAQSLTMTSSQPKNAPAIVQIGCGTDLHGQDATVASVRACRNAIQFNSLPALRKLLPNGDLSKMDVQVSLGIPKEFQHTLDVDRVQQQFPYGIVTVTVKDGGLTCSSGVVLPEQGDAPSDDRAIVVVAAVSVLI